MRQILRNVRRWLGRKLWRTSYRSQELLAASQPTVEDTFRYIYRHNIWNEAESASGTGSSLEQTRFLRARLPAILKELGAQALLDIPCGDHYWLNHVELGVASYTGADIVEELIATNQARYARPGKTFLKLDLLTSTLPAVDVVLCRDCLVHFSNEHVWQALRQIRTSASTYLLTTTYPQRANDKNILTGQWRPLNLEAPPFALPVPLLTVVEGATERKGRFADKSLALWRIADLPDSLVPERGDAE